MNFNHVKSYHKNHPNPQFYRENYELLNGLWKFCYDENDQGELNHYEINFPKDSYDILVPYAYQAKKNENNIPYKQCDVIWYHKEIDVKEIKNKVLLKFFGVDYKTTLYVNGINIGTHIGAYTQFEFDITNALKLGKNNITLRVVDRMLSNQFRGKQRWKKDNFTCFYKEFSGIYKDVILENVNDNYIKNFKCKGDYLSQNIELDISLFNDNFDYLEFKVIDHDTNETNCYKLNKENLKTIIKFNNPKAWSNLNPFLYDCIFTLYKDGKIIDEVSSYFGFVSYQIQNKHIYINNIDTYLKLVLEQSYYLEGGITPKESEIIEDALLIKDYGFNGLRKHELVPTPLCFYYYDLLGLYVWQEVPSAYGYSYDMNKQYHTLVPEQINQNYNHPSIMCYVLFNESWGIEEIAQSKEEQKFVDEMYEFVKNMNTGRFVIGNDGWEHIKTDLLTLHNYSESSKDLHNQYDNNFKLLKEGQNPYSIDNHKRFYAGDYRYNNEPIILSEFAGIALTTDIENDNNNWGYGKSANGELAFIEKYSDLLSFIKSHEDIRGFCMTQFSDVEQETNGLVTINRVPKVNKEKIKQLHEEFK